MVLMNPGDGLGLSVNTHTCILQLLMVVGVDVTSASDDGNKPRAHKLILLG